MGVNTVFSGSDYREKVTILRYAVPLEERGCFTFFALELAKFSKRTEATEGNNFLHTSGIFPLIKTAHEDLLRTAYNKSGEVTKGKMRELVEYLKSNGSPAFDI